MKSILVDTSLGEIEYCSAGKGTPIIFIHGGHSNCFETLSHKGFDLEKFQLLTPSRPGYGRTPLQDNKSPKQAAVLIVELLKYLTIDSAIVYGISAGGLTAIELAAQHPGKVEKLVLASATSKKWLDEDEKIYKIAQMLFHPNLERFTWGMVKFFSKIFPKEIARSFFPQFSAHPMHRLNRTDIDELVLALNKYNSKEGFLNDIDQDISSETIAKIKCPCLIVHSRNDNSVSFEHALHSKAMIEHSILMELDNEWGHLFWIGEDADESIQKTLKFIQG